MPGLSRLLFWLVLGLAGLLILLVFLAPLLDNGRPADGGSRVLALFARDATLRRTAAASALGLAATAFIFFRRRGHWWSAAHRAKSSRRPPSQNVAGA
jgi:hypothetical protein